MKIGTLVERFRMTDAALMCSHVWTKIIENWLMSSRQSWEIIISINSLKWSCLKNGNFVTVTWWSNHTWNLFNLHQTCWQNQIFADEGIAGPGVQHFFFGGGRLTRTHSFIWTPLKGKWNSQNCEVTRLLQMRGVSEAQIFQRGWLSHIWQTQVLSSYLEAQGGGVA